MPGERPSPAWARRLTNLRRARAWSPADLAYELKRLRADLPSAKSLAHMIQMDWESGRHRPGPRYRLLLASVYDADEQDIFGDETAAPAKADDQATERLRRTFTAQGLASLTFPALNLDGLRRISVALSDARRYADEEIVGHCRQQLRDCVSDDGVRGPGGTLPTVLGLIAVIEQIATSATPAVRRELLRVGAQAAEFAGWLYRDVAMPELANYWRDRAIEWAQVSGDLAMQGYVLLKKSQAVWDERDAMRMLTLAEAVQEGPWELPARVRAEAAQQEARGHAMLSGDLKLAERKIEEARDLLAQDRQNESVSGRHVSDIAGHYDEALLWLQVAICFCEAGHPLHAIELYDEWLSADTFSPRDYGYFLALKGAAFASAERPDEASDAGSEALGLARETGSVRTLQEIIRLALQLRIWGSRESVQHLQAAVLV